MGLFKADRKVLASHQGYSQKQQITNNNRPFSHSFENRYLQKTPGVSLLAYGTLFTPKKSPSDGGGVRGVGSINGETSHQLGGRKLVFMV